MSELDDQPAQLALQAIHSAAEDLGVEPIGLAKRLRDGEIARLIRLLNAALEHVSHPALRHHIEDLLSSVTDGKMPMFERPESGLDRAMQALRQRREQPGNPERAAGAEGEP